MMRTNKVQPSALFSVVVVKRGTPHPQSLLVLVGAAHLHAGRAHTHLVAKVFRIARQPVVEHSKPVGVSAACPALNTASEEKAVAVFCRFNEKC